MIPATRTSRRTLIHPAWTLSLLLAAACTGEAPAQGVPNGSASEADRVIAAAQGDPALAGALEEIRAATEKYRDVEVALADGYMRDPTDMCVTPGVEGLPKQLGGMGIHFFRPDLLGITAVEPRVTGVGTHQDFRQPGILVYEPQEDGSLELVAVENLIFAEGWHAAGHEGPPEYMGNQYYHLVDNPETPVDEAHGFEPHYELHLWLYRENPSGPFSPFNPRATCDHHAGEHAGH